MMSIVKATRRYDTWVGDRTPTDAADLRLKHKRMAEGIFPFFRATFYRWMQHWREVCPLQNAAPQVLAVGDLHVENFGTWRDVEGRLIWGVNDFDEVAAFPYTVDLVRLAASALLAAREGHLALRMKDACTAILSGYRESLEEHGRPFVLAEKNKWLRDIATSELRDPEHFWQKMDSLKTVNGEIPPSAQEALESLLPEQGIECRVVKRIAGLGSLGHLRFVAIGYWQGGRLAREAKALAPSAVYWAEGLDGPGELNYQTILSRAVRCRDPFVRLRGRWLVRRLAPYCSRIELDVVPKVRDELKLLFSMGYETANIHLGTPEARKPILRHLDKAKAGWLLSAAEEMDKAITQDWKTWRLSRAK